MSFLSYWWYWWYWWCWCETVKHHLYWSTGFINMLLSNTTDAQFTSWDPAGLMSLYSVLQLHPSLHLSSSFPHLLQVYYPLLSPPNNPPPLKLALQINHEVLNCHADKENRGSNAKRRACLPFKASCSGIWLTLALRALTQREAEWMKGLGHFKRTHVFCQSLWLSWRSNQRAFRFKKGYFTSRPSG